MAPLDNASITHGIQLAVAPVFLLTAVSGMIAAVGSVSDMALPEVKTTALAQALVKLDAPKALVVDAGDNQNLRLSARNLADSSFLDVRGLNVYDILRFPKLLISETSLRQIEARLSGAKTGEKGAAT